MAHDGGINILHDISGDGKKNLRHATLGTINNETAVIPKDTR